MDLDIMYGSVLAGTIRNCDTMLGTFSYDPAFAAAFPKGISISLPPDKGPFDLRQYTPYFEGLLPEQRLRNRMVRKLGLASDETYALLRALGRDCAGALRIVCPDDPPGNPASYEPLGERKLHALSTSDQDAIVDMQIQGRLSLAGAQAKVPLFLGLRNAVSGNQGKCTWYLPLGDAPSSHIVKPQSLYFVNMVENEFICTTLAQQCGIDSPPAFIDRERSLFAIARYDRTFDHASDSQAQTSQVSGFVVPQRLHQEDFCQALGVLSTRKYEEEGGPSLADCLDLIRNVSARPLADAEQFVRRIIFYVLIGNCDFHAKNFSLLYSRDLSHVSLAPAYDIVSTVIYPNLVTDTAMVVGRSSDIRAVTREDLAALARPGMLSRRKVHALIDDVREQLYAALTDIDALHAPDAGPAEPEVAAVCEKVRAFASQRLAELA